MKYDIVLYAPNGFKTERLLQLPLGLMAISSCLKKAGFTVKIVSEFTLEDNIRVALESIDDNTIFFGINSLSGTTVYDALLVSKKIKEKHPELPTVWGGSHVTLLPEQTVKHPLIDIVVRGQGEITVVRLAKALQNPHKYALNFIDGITFKFDGEIINTPDAKFVDINNFPMLDYDAVDMDKYIKPADLEQTHDDITNRVIGYSSSRGCPMRCEFCAISALMERHWLRYTPERVVKELEILKKKYNMSGVIFADDNFFVDKERIEKICDLLIKKKLNLSWGANCRCDYFANFSDEFIEKLKKAGCVDIFFGAESGSQRILDYMKKDITVEQILDCARRTRHHGIKAKFFFMMGFPDETVEDLHKTMDLLDKIYKIIPETTHPVLIYTPYAKTALMEKAKARGFIPPDNLEDWGMYNFLRYEKPWGTKEYQNIVKVFSIICHFLLGYQTTDRFPKLWMKIAFKILKADAKFRWKHKFFKFAWEWKLVKRYYDNQLENCKKQWLEGLKC